MEVYGNSTSSRLALKYYTAQFKRGRISILDKARPNGVTISEIIEKIYDIVVADREVKLCDQLHQLHLKELIKSKIW